MQGAGIIMANILTAVVIGKVGIIMIKVGIVGAAGYTGRELIRLLAGHPQVEIRLITSRTYAGKTLAEVFGVFRSFPEVGEFVFADRDVEKLVSQVDCLFVAAPAGTAMEYASICKQSGTVLIDLGTDFRFADAAIYEKTYGINHSCADLLSEARYGLPELWRSDIAGSRIIGNPGCYPTSALLALAPLAHSGLLKSPVNISSVSGVSGAGSTPGPMYHYPDRTENVEAYKPVVHRHGPEIATQLAKLAQAAIDVIFVPHLVPMSRGIFTTVFAQTKVPLDTGELEALYLDFYRYEPFVEVLVGDILPQTKAVAGTNSCHLAVKGDYTTKTVVAMSVIDNLGKGAAGQAVQNMNIVYGWQENTGLSQIGLVV